SHWDTAPFTAHRNFGLEHQCALATNSSDAGRLRGRPYSKLLLRHAALWMGANPSREVALTVAAAHGAEDLNLTSGIRDLHHIRRLVVGFARGRDAGQVLPPSEMTSFHGSTTRRAVMDLSYLSLAWRSVCLPTRGL